MWIKRKEYDKMVVRIKFLGNQLCPNGVHDFNRLMSNLAKETELLNMLTEALYKKRKDFQTTALDLCITE